MAHTITTKYNPSTGKITVDCWRKRIFVEAYTTKAESGAEVAHTLAAEKLVAFLNQDKEGVEWHIIAAAEGIKPNTYTFIIQTRAMPETRTEYRVMWEIDTLADSYESAARWTQDTFFAQGHAGHFEVKAKGDKHPVVVDFIGE